MALLLIAAVLLGGPACSSPPASTKPAAQPIELDAPRLPAELKLARLDGQLIDPLAGLDRSAAVSVFIFTRTDCPIANRYAPEILRLSDQLTPSGVRFHLVYIDKDEALASIEKHLEDFGYAGQPITPLRDDAHQLVDFVEARVTPSAAVFNENRQLLYAGRIDDRFPDFGKARAKPGERDLLQAVQAVLNGKTPPTQRTQAVGCYIADLK